MTLLTDSVKYLTLKLFCECSLATQFQFFLTELKKLRVWYQKLQQSLVSMAIVLLPPPHVYLLSAGIQHV